MTAKSDQLARIAAVVPPAPEPTVKIVKLEKSGWMWLCEPCLAKRLSLTDAHLETRRPTFPLACQDCTWRKEHP